MRSDYKPHSSRLIPAPLTPQHRKKTMQALILIIHVLACITIVALVLMQHGRGADVGASFGSGASTTMFGSAGSVPFLMKVTAICAALFFTTSISLSYIASVSQHKAQNLNMQILPTLPHENKTVVPVSSKDKIDNTGVTFTPSAPLKEPKQKRD